MKTYEDNRADTHLVVKSLKVLESIDGGGIKEIRQSVDAVKKQTVAIVKQTETYWNQLSDDGVISVIEKQNLKREMENIRQSYTAVTQQATSLGYSNPILQDYAATYTALRTYINDTLKLFDDMTTETKIPDRNYFNSLFSSYFFMENFILLAITKGILDTVNIRVLQNLEEEGTEGELAIYRGSWYQHVDGEWKNITTGSYKGAKSSLPDVEEGAFFLASETFVMLDTLYVNETELYVNGDILGVTNYVYKGYIYYCLNGVWYKEEDKTNWRYAAAFADIINVTGELPQIFQNAIDNLQDSINDISGQITDITSTQDSLAAEIATKQGQYTIINGELVLINDAIQDIIDRANAQASDIEGIEGELESGIIKHLPVYFGASTVIPANPEEGDFFLYSGSTTATGNSDFWHFANIYRYSSGSWERLLSSVSAYRHYYMMALEDILSITETTDGYFNSVFANAFFANDATMSSLSVRTIYLQQNGVIQSANTTYELQREGISIDAAGNIDANKHTHLGGKVAIGVDLYNSQNQLLPDFNNYDVVIGGNTKITGMLEGATGRFNGDLIGGKVYFSALGLYGLIAGNDTVEKYTSSNFYNNGLSKTKVIIDCADSSLKLNIEVSGYAGGDTYSHPSVILKIYYKINGTVSSSNYTDCKIQTFNSGRSGTVYTMSLLANLSIVNPGEYVEVLLEYDTDGIWCPPTGEISLGVEGNNKYLKSCLEFSDLQ